jgi:hypothetical protein
VAGDGGLIAGYHRGGRGAMPRVLSIAAGS